MGYLDAGDWVQYRGIDFGANGAKTFSAGVAVAPGMAGKKIQIRVGSPTGAVIGTLTMKSTGGWGKFTTQATAVGKVTGVQDVYLTFAGGSSVANMKWFKFS
jgi:arabinoxylan arabinofuranohydrolase